METNPYCGLYGCSCNKSKEVIDALAKIGEPKDNPNDLYISFVLAKIMEDK